MRAPFACQIFVACRLHSFARRANTQIHVYISSKYFKRPSEKVKYWLVEKGLNVRLAIPLIPYRDLHLIKTTFRSNWGYPMRKKNSCMKTLILLLVGQFAWQLYATVVRSELCLCSEIVVLPNYAKFRVNISSNKNVCHTRTRFWSFSFYSSYILE